MRVFVTGAAGFIGRAVVQDLLQNGHSVLALARSDASADAVTKAGAIPHRGDLEDTASLESGAAASDGVIHLAFIHDFANFARANAIDYAAIEALGRGLAGTNKPLVIASGTLGYPPGVPATEDTEPERDTPLSDRVRASDLVVTLSKEKQIRGCVIRLCPTVHGVEDKGMIPGIAKIAREKGDVLPYIGDGASRWPAVHRSDAAVLFRLVLEKGKPGAVYNAVQEEGVAMKEIMAITGRKLGMKVEGKSVEEAVGVLGFFAYVIGRDNPVSSRKTREELGWSPKGVGLLKDLEENYFK